MGETTRRKRRHWPFVLGGIVAVIALFLILFQWDWLLPIVDSRASAALGRRVTAQHLHVQLGRVTHITLDGVRIANPKGWAGGGDFATAQHLTVALDAMALIRSRSIVIPTIALDHPVVDAEQRADGTANWDFSAGSKTTSSKSSSGTSPKIGEVQIVDGTVHVVDPKLKADVNLAVNTTKAGAAPAQLHATAKGTYAKQPITGTFTGGALLTLRDPTHPYPIDLHVANGPTKVSLVGTVKDPLSFKGARVKLVLQGPDMRLLYPLTGIPIPQTPPYHVAGNLDYAAGQVRFTGFQGTVGHSDLAGDIAVKTGGKKPVVDATLTSRRVDLQDLGGFIGSTPGRKNERGQTPQQRAELARATASKKLIPDTPINLPKLNAADVHLHYKAESILGRGQPLDDMVANLDIVNGNVKLHPLSFGIGGGQVQSQIALSQAKAGLHTRADVDFQRIPILKLLKAAGVSGGAGTIGGRMVLQGTGHSMAQILGHGTGDLKLAMGPGGTMSAFLVDLSGLEFGNAVLSALGIPKNATIKCLLAEAKLQNGVARPDPFLLDTSEATVGMTGEINLLRETLGLQLRTKPKHFSIGTLPAPINIGGTLKHPSILPDVKALAARGGAAVGLGVLLTPLAALIPTIQFGTGKTHACAGLARAEAPPHLPPPARR